MKIGAGWQDIVNERKKLGHKNLEDSSNPEWTVYFARSHVIDHVTGIEARGPLKIGRGKYMNNIQRGRNQDGSDFRVYARLILERNEDTKLIESYIKRKYSKKHFSGPQTTQKELYNISDSEIRPIIDEILSWTKDINIPVEDVRFYIA